MRVLVTGGAGFIGSHTCLSLLKAGHDVAVVENFRNSNIESLSRVATLAGRSPEVHHGDVRDTSTLKDFFLRWKPDGVVHFAGLKSVAESSEIPGDYYATNVQGTLNVAELAVAAGVRRLVFSSSATVYGADASMPVKEEAWTAPINPYGHSKLFAEQVLKDIHRANPQLSVGILRYFNPVGAHESGQLGEDPTGVPANLMPYMARVAAGAYPRLFVYGDDYPTADGTGVRDYIHVMDLADAHLQTLMALEAEPGFVTWNVGRGEGISVLEMVAAFESVTGRSVPVEVVGRRPGDAATSFADVSCISQATPWRATRNVEDMVRDLWRWQSDNPHGYGGSPPSTGVF